MILNTGLHFKGSNFGSREQRRSYFLPDIRGIGRLLMQMPWESEISWSKEWCRVYIWRKPIKNKKDRCGFVTQSADAYKYKRRPFLRPPLDVDVDYLIIVTVPEDSRSWFSQEYSIFHTNTPGLTGLPLYVPSQKSKGLSVTKTLVPQRSKISKTLSCCTTFGLLMP